MRNTRVACAAFSAIVLLARPARAEPDADPWFGKDKALHFSVAGTIAAGGYVAGAFLFDARRDALLLGGGLAIAAGIGKETLDLAGYGDPSWKDLAWDGIGTLASLAVAWGVVRYLSGELGYMAVSSSQLGLGVALMLVTAMIAGFTPALRASRLDIVDALRSVRR